MTDQQDNNAIATNDDGDPSSGKRRIDLAFIRSGDISELIVMGAPTDIVIRHAFWNYDKQEISALYNQDLSDDERATFLEKAIASVQRWDQNGGMDRLKDQQRIRQLEEQVQRLGGKI